MKPFILAALCFVAFTAQAQLAPDQNPNYMVSQQKYMQAKDSLQAGMNTTLQQTYKAYDWYQAKLERKQNRIENRNQRRLYSNLYNNGFNGYNGYYNGLYNNYGYGGRYGNRFYRNSPYIGYRTGNWWFWF